MHELADRTRHAALDAAARWLGVGVASLPALDLADRHGLLTMLASPQSIEGSTMVVPLLQVAFFVAVGIGASMVLRRHRAGARGWFFAGCSGPVLVYVLASGLRLSVVISLVALCFAFVQLRLAGDVPPRGARPSASS